MSINVKEKLLSGVEKINAAVSSTLGPGGRNVIIKQFHNDPVITKDGVSVAKAFELEDVNENAAVRLIKRVAMNVLEEVGDGTTTATILASSIFKEGLETLKGGGITPTQLQREIKQASAIIVEELKRHAWDITEADQDYLYDVASISANGDTEIANTIFEAVQLAGKDGLIKVDVSNSVENVLERVDGIEHEVGYLSSHFITDEGNNSVEYEGCNIVLFDKKLDNLHEVNEWLAVVGTNPLLIIANDYSSEVLAFLTVNKMHGNINAVAIKAPGYGEYRKAYMEDLSIFLNAPVYNLMSEKVNPSKFGFATKVLVTANKTTIFGSEKKDQSLIDEYVSTLREKKNVVEGEYDIDVLNKRIASLTDGLVTIKVGARTQVELYEKKDRVEDSLLATQAAVEEGIIIGGGFALAKLSKFVPNTIGGEVLAKAMMEPLITNLRNADITTVTIDDNQFETGTNIRTMMHGNLYSIGVIDPVKVTRIALENAVSIASLLLTTEHIV